ncbi:MAG TPA: hypothetical protein VFN55_17770 [Solirubrobacteraceae bacterium]|nr:hypothetical protein [Solirubrobacteraceae bacterium]
MSETRPGTGPESGAEGSRPGPEPEAALTPAEGFIAPALASEFPGLRLVWATTAARRRPSPRALARRLAAAADRYRGAGVIAMRTKPVPGAYRSFFRQVGLDPDVQRIPAEHVALERLVHGGFRPGDVIDDACRIALIETGVPVYAVDADRVAAGGLGIRPVLATELEPAPPAQAPRAGIQAGALVVADAERVHALLFSPPGAGHAPGPRTERVTLYAVGVDGVPQVHIEEAIWIALEILGPAAAS